MNRVAVAIAGAAIAVTAFAIGRVTAPDAPVLSVERAARSMSGKRAGMGPDKALEECESRLAFARQVLDAKERAENGTPVPFPADLPPQYGPEGFEDAVEDAMRACPQPARRLARVDCSEFPCMAFFVREQNADENDGMVPPCERWTELFGPMGGSATDQIMTEDGLLAFSMQSVAPADKAVAFDANRQLRWTKRLEEGKAEVIADVDGRELTELEQIDRQIEFLREWDGDDDFVAALEARRAELAAQENAAP